MGVEEHERAKYERIWNMPKYREFSPGEELVDEAIDRLGMNKGSSVIDYGCGTGRPAFKFQLRGMQVRGVDHADNCMDEGLNIPFVNACLWQLPILASDYAFCTDVMEHLPEDKVADVFQGIAVRTNIGGFFQIFTKPDGFGQHIGEPLHLTVRPPEWWEEQFARFWYVAYRKDFGNRVILAGEPLG